MLPTMHVPCLIAAIVASIAGMVTGITQGLPAFSWVSSILFALALVFSAIDLNAPWWRAETADRDPSVPVLAAVRNARLLVLGYMWGAVALFMIYRMTQLRWQHGLQYGAGMALIGWLILLYVHLLIQPGSRLRSQRALSRAMWLSMAHGGAALTGVLFLVLSGKINSIKDDWAANQIFFAGGLAIVGLSLVASYTQLRLARHGQVDRQAHRSTDQPA